MKKGNIILMIYLVINFSILTLYENNAKYLGVDSCDCLNNIGIKNFQQDIIFVYKSIKVKDTLNLKFNFDTVLIDKNKNIGFIPEVILKIENLTQIYSKSDGNYFGKFNPKYEDIKNWLDWYDKNKLNICWDTLGKKYYFSKKK